MAAELFYKSKKFDSIDTIIEKYSLREFKSPYRSTIPLLILYRESLDNLFGLIDFEFEENLKYDFEFETKVLNGRGRSSCTDLMITSSDSCIAVEAKWTEPPYKSVRNWLEDSINKTLVLNGWIKLISNYTGISFEIEDINDLPYQLIHRIASACSKNRERTHVVYLVFDLNSRYDTYYSTKFDSLSKLLDDKVKLYLANYKIEKLPEQKRLENLWNVNKERNLSTNVVDGILSKSLMNISKVKVDKK